MEKLDFWRLTVAYWPRAAQADLQPCPTQRIGEEGPQFYRPLDIDFARPPTREDSLAVVRQTPWMHVWEATLLPVLAQSDWPIVPACHKAAKVGLNALGKVVGELRVRRHCLYVN
jgi:hypothetical protein